MKLGMAVLRMVVGFLMMGHGLQKLTGWFRGHGLEATGKSFEGMGLVPGRPHAAMAGAAEAGGGALLAAGLLTPLGSSMVTGSMAVAIHKVHGKNGPWISEGGFEYNLVLATSAFAIAAAGPGGMSMDERLGISASGPAFAFAELAAALAAAAAIVRRRPREQKTQEPASRQGVERPREAQREAVGA